ncbi:MAG: hypothetical protein B7X55_11815, partial [Rhodobacterales bacterium 34-62-10]
KGRFRPAFLFFGPFVLRVPAPTLNTCATTCLLTGDAAESKVNQAVGLAVREIDRTRVSKDVLGRLGEMKYQNRNDV